MVRSMTLHLTKAKNHFKQARSFTRYREKAEIEWAEVPPTYPMNSM